MLLRPRCFATPCLGHFPIEIQLGHVEFQSLLRPQLASAGFPCAAAKVKFRSRATKVSKHLIMQFMALDDYFWDVVATALVNAWSTRECGFGYIGSRRNLANKDRERWTRFLISMAYRVSD